VIRNLPSGIPGFDTILGGGVPEFSFNIIAGGPGCGKTTMAHQFIFANATPQRPALYFTILGESPIKMLRYQQQYSFFDPAKLNGAIRFINLSQIVLEKELSAVLMRSSGKWRRRIRRSSWWTRFAPQCGDKRPRWTCNSSFSNSPCI
jgi:circadian clock protein KaiC